MSNSDKWDWNSEESRGDVVIPRVDAIAVYVNNNNDVVIRQQDPMGDEDAFIILPKERVQALVQALMGVIDQ